MKINEILVESEQLQEGPLLNKVGSAVGKGVGTLAKGAGAVAGGIAGIGSAVKKGFQAGKATVGSGGDTDPNAADAQGGQAADPNAAGGGATAQAAPAQGQPQGFMAGLKQGLAGKKSAPAAGGNAPAAQGGAAAPAAGSGQDAAAPTTAADINAQGPTGTAAVKQQSGAAAQAVNKTAQATANQDAAQAGQTVYAQVKSNIDKLDKKGKQRIMQLLQKSLAQPGAADQKAAANPAAGGAGAMGQMANQLANTGTSSTGGQMQGTATGVKHTANPNNPNAQQAAPAADAQVAPADQTAAPATTAKPRARKPVKIAGNKQAPAAQPQQLAASKENRGTMVAEGFSLFRKR